MNWISEQVRQIRELEGQVVSSIVATEWPLRFSDEDEPLQYEHPDLPFLQLWALYLKLSSGKTIKFNNYQNDDIFGICLSAEIKPWEPDFGGEYLDCCRTKELEGYPTGLITSIDVLMELGDIAEVLIDFSGDSILLVAGEVEEEYDGELVVYRNDESILLFRHPEQKKDVNLHWGPSCALF